jgi:hypothetical protein
MIRAYFVLLLVFLAPKLLANPLFPKSYEESRERFTALSALTSGELTRLPIPSNRHQDLSIEALYLRGDNPRHLLVLASGVHGSEAPAGSAGLELYLKEYAKTYQERGLSVVLLHSINPYGHKFGRRVSENNIDLNRNFPLSSDLYQTPNPSYGKLHSVLNPQRRLNSYLLTTTRATLGLLRALTLRGIGVDEIRQASVGGQYTHPQGIYFGGFGPEIHVSLLHDYLAPILSEYEKILVLDIHTGLGEKGQLYLISAASQTPQEEKIMRQVFPTPGPTTYELTASSDPGFYPTTGDFTDYFHGLASHAQVVSLTFEFGTLGLSLPAQLQTLNRLIAENQLHHFGARSNSIDRRVRSKFEELFNPSDKSWRNEVVSRTRHIFEHSIPLFLQVEAHATP